MSSLFLSHFKGQSGLLLITSMLTGLSHALVMPLLNFFMVTEVKAQPYLAGLSIVTIALSGVVLSLWFGRIADKGSSTKTLYLIGMAGVLFTGLIFANLRDFWFLLLCGTIFMGLGYVSLPQMFALARQFSEKHDKNITDFNSLYRAAFSFAWVMGPALAFSLVAWQGFSGAFYSAAAVAFIAIIFGLWGLPNYRKTAEAPSPQEKPILSSSFWLLAIAVGFANMANMMYNVSIPLYLTQELSMHKSLPGWVMGTAAALEIPAMILSARYASRHGKVHTLKIGMLVGILFYVSTYYVAQSFWHFLILQLLNGTFFGILAGLGLTVMQDQLPKHPGYSSAFYTNALEVGTLAGAFCAGMIAQFFDFHSVIIASALMVFLSLAMLFWFGRVVNNTLATTGSPTEQNNT